MSRPATPMAQASCVRASSGTSTSTKSACNTRGSGAAVAVAAEKAVSSRTAQRRLDSERAMKFTQKRVAAIEAARQLDPAAGGPRGAAGARGCPLALMRRRPGNAAPPPSLSIDLAAVSPVPMTKFMSMRRQLKQQTATAASARGGPGRMTTMEASVPGMFRPDGHDQRHHASPRASSPPAAARMTARPPWLCASPRADSFGKTWRPSGAESPAVSLHACVNQQVVEVAYRAHYYYYKDTQVVQRLGVGAAAGGAWAGAEAGEGREDSPLHPEDSPRRAPALSGTRASRGRCLCPKPQQAGRWSIHR